MNAPFPARTAEAADRLHLFAFFHLNLAFSSIEEDKRGEVIRRAYWPLLRLAERHVLGMEISGYTLEEIAARDPAWIERARELIAEGRIELIGSGYSQMIGPLVPQRVTAENLRLGHEAYRCFLGIRPRIALVGEQAYSAGLVGLYLDAGFDALIMDYDNPAAHHPEWGPDVAFRPARALGADGRAIALIWSHTTLFQQLQRFAHGDTGLESWRGFVESRRGDKPRALCLYASDAEIFDFRPGRFKTEEQLSPDSEWARLDQAFAAAGQALVRPSAILDLLPLDGPALKLESAACPVPVKKQRKYNLARWAVTGRDNVAINAACHRIYRGMLADEAKADWKELCYLWASDFRTHLTEKRWQAYCRRLEAAETRWAAALPAPFAVPMTSPANERRLSVETPSLKALLDRRRGLAIQNLQFKGHARAALGGLPHGYFGDIALQADWYTGDCVFEAPGEHKLTDLEWCDAHIGCDAGGDVLAHARLETQKGSIEKRMRFFAAEPKVEFDISLDWSDWGKGVLRLGHFTLQPGAFNPKELRLVTDNGGGAECFALAGQTIDHGAAVSFLVSSSHGLPLSAGWAVIGDGKTDLRIEVDCATAPLLGLLTFKPAKDAQGGDSFFCQLALSALELDDTRKPAPYDGGPRRFRFSVSAVK